MSKTKEISFDGFELVAVETLPDKSYRKGSKYDPFLKFLAGQDRDLMKIPNDHPLFKEKMERDEGANYIANQLKKRRDALGKMEGEDQVIVPYNFPVVNNQCYAEIISEGEKAE